MSTLAFAVINYSKLPLNDVEALLKIWLSDAWQKAQFRDILTPVLIQRKLELNEEEY